MQTQDTRPLPIVGDKRDAKALVLLNTGRVHLLPGQKFGLVDGSKGQSYTVSRDGCSCPDWSARRPEGGCCHQRALRAVCALYKACRTEARETGRTRLPWALGLALRPVVKEEAPAASVPTCRHGEPAGCPVCRSEAWAREDRETCLKCGAALVNGRCPAQDARLRERADLDALLFGEAA